MDSDDYSYPERMESQLSLMVENGLDMVGSQVIEFVESPNAPVAQTDCLKIMIPLSLIRSVGILFGTRQ
jgi:hypothetical protein